VRKELHVVLEGAHERTECMFCGRSRYVKVVNEDGASVSIKVAVK
jgi:hypothetical protein